MNEVRSHKGPKFTVNIEGTDHDWERDTITPEEISKLAGWAPETQVIEVNEQDQSETTLTAGQPVQLKPGQGFGKKIKFKRG